MTVNEGGLHVDSVERWMDGAVRGRTPEEQIWAFERAFDSLWRRAHQTLGEVTLNAIADRVLYTAAERYSILAPLKLDVEGPRWQELRERIANVTDDRLQDPIQFVIMEFLTVLGNLTADILTPSLHAALIGAVPENGRKVSPRERQAGSPPDGEEAKS